MRKLALVLRDQENYTGAEDLKRRVLMMRKAALGVDHPDKLTIGGDLISILQDQEKYPEEEATKQWLMLETEKT